MGTATALFDAVDALRKKIVAAAATATPEELAYLGNALEKIAGHVTLLELSEHVDSLKTVLDGYKTTIEADFASTIATQTQNAQSDLARTKETYLAELGTKQMNAQSDLARTKETYLAELGTKQMNAQSDLARTKETYLAELGTKQTNFQAAITQTETTANQTMHDTAATLIDQVNGILAQLAAAVEVAKNTAETVKNVQPINEADIMFYMAG